MKKMIGFAFLTVAAALLVNVARAGNFDVEIHCVPKRVDENPGAGSRGTVIASKEHWAYDVTVENKTFKDLAGLEVKYIIFFKQERLGEKGAGKLRRKAGTFPIELLKPHEKKTFTTSEVELTKAKLSVDFYYPSGGKETAQDILNGLWLRVFQGGQQFAEFANPSSLMKEKWE